jgi:hypothetical protein
MQVSSGCWLLTAAAVWVGVQASLTKTSTTPQRKGNKTVENIVQDETFKQHWVEETDNSFFESFLSVQSNDPSVVKQAINEYVQDNNEKNELNQALEQQSGQITKT